MLERQVNRTSWMSGTRLWLIRRRCSTTSSRLGRLWPSPAKRGGNHLPGSRGGKRRGRCLLMGGEFWVLKIGDQDIWIGFSYTISICNLYSISNLWCGFKNCVCMYVCLCSVHTTHLPDSKPYFAFHFLGKMMCGPFLIFIREPFPLIFMKMRAEKGVKIRGQILY